MFADEPGEYLLLQFRSETGELRRVCHGDRSRHVVLGRVAFATAHIEVIRVRLADRTKNQGKRGKCSVMSEILFGSITGRVKEDGAEFQRRIVSYAKSPVGRDLPSRIQEVSIHNAQQVGDLSSTGSVRPESAIIRPLLQAHVRCR